MSFAILKNMTRFVGRVKELSALKELFKKRSSSLVVIHGRRRIGKSRLIEEFGKKIKPLKFSGLPPHDETTKESQREEFARQMAQNLNIPLPRADDWGDLFSHLGRFTQSGKLLLVLDEISWIGAKDPNFLGKLKNAWDDLFSKNPKLILIICGSVSSWIEKNILSSTGFMGRISLDLVLDELPLPICKQFWEPHPELSSPFEMFKVLSVTGGVPRYLEEILPSQTAEHNLQRLCFRKEGILVKEFERIFHDLFSSRSPLYKKIIIRLAEGRATLSDIYQTLKVQPTGVCSEYLNDLIQAGFVAREYTWNIKNSKQSNLSYFRLSDNYLRFYLKFIAPHREQILDDTFRTKSIFSLPGWSAVMGLQFENLVLNNFNTLWKSLGYSFEEVTKKGPYFQRKSRDFQGCQVDLLVQTAFNVLYLFEIKFSKSKIPTSVINEVKEKISRLAIPKGFSVKPILIHVNGVSDELEESHFFAEIVDFSDLL